LRWVGSNMTKVLYFWWLHTQHTTTRGRGASEIHGVWKIGVFRPVSCFISKMVQDTAMLTMEDHVLAADRFAVSCIGLGWVHVFRFAMGWVGSLSW